MLAKAKAARSSPRESPGASDARPSPASPAVAATQARVKPTTQRLRRPVASDAAPTHGAARSTTTEERLIAIDSAVLLAPRSATIQTAK